MSLVREVVDLKQLEEDAVGFSKLADYLRREAGINLMASDKNRTLLASRMCKIIPQLGFSGYHDLHAGLLSGSAEIRNVFISAITTNTTHFFREMPHFNILAKTIREMSENPILRKNKELRIWCAACSSGEEPYSIAMVVKSNLPAYENWTIRILASDIDNDILKRAARGVYPSTALESVPPEFKKQYFESGKGQSADYVRVRKEIRNLITFAPFNLMSPTYSFQNKFDIIFCRNVMIYFDKPEIQSTIRKLESTLRVGGYLFVGHSETIMGSTPTLKSRAAAVYEKLPAKQKGEAA